MLLRIGLRVSSLCSKQQVDQDHRSWSLLFTVDLCVPQSFRIKHVTYICRSLEILDSGTRYLGLASPQVESFTYGPVFEEEEEEKMMDCIATLAGLTKLEFTRVPFRHQARFSELRRLHLQELSFERCTGIAAVLNHPDAFAVLQKLCIKESSEIVQAFEAAENGGGPTQDLGEVVMMRDNVLNLPSLMELSGWCRIFSLHMPVNWKLWCKERMSYDPTLLWRRVA